MLAMLMASGSIVTGVCLSDQTPRVEPVWQTDGLDNPESVIPDGEGGFIVSNVNGEGAGRDANGYLARLDATGRITTSRWTTGLDAPKGLDRLDTRIYVTDIDQIVEIDAASGRVVDRHAVAGASFLNDAAVHDGALYVSDSGRGRIYRLVDGIVTLWLEDEALAGLNGLLPETDRLLVTTMDRGEVIAIDWDSQALTVLAGELSNADGIAQAPGGGYFVSQWPGQVWHLDAGRVASPVFDREADGVLMNDLVVVGDLLVVPHWAPGRVSAWRIRCAHD